MQVTVQWTKICEQNHEKHPEPLEEEFKDVWDIATDREDGIIMLRFESQVYQLNRSCILRMEVDI